MEHKILGSCDCPDGPQVQSKKHAGASYVHVETPQGIRCCPKLRNEEFEMGVIIEFSKSKKSELKKRDEAVVALISERKKKKDTRETLIKDLREKRANGEDMSQGDLNSLVDALLPK